MSVPIKDRTLKSQSQQLILNLLNYFEREKVNKGPLLSLASIQEVSCTFFLNFDKFQLFVACC